MLISTRVSVACAMMAAAAIGCAPDDAERLGEAVSRLADGAKRAANGNACTEGQENNANENDCLTIEVAWAANGARPTTEQNAGKKLVYTGIDATDDAGLIASEKLFAAGFGTTNGAANGGVYGAHGLPAAIQGLPNNAAGGGNGTILHETFGVADIPWLGLSVCYAGNSGAHASRGQLDATPAAYQNNISPASFITTYFGIASARIVACQNGTVRPEEATLWCGQNKYRRDGWTVARILGNATVIEGNGTARGSATTKEASDDATGDFTHAMQAAAPARSFKARNLPRRRIRANRDGELPHPWNLASRCNCPSGICTAQDNYPRFWIETYFGPTPTVPSILGVASPANNSVGFGSGSGFPGIDAGMPDGGGGSGSGSGSGSDGGLPDGGGGSGSGDDGGSGSGSGSGDGDGSGGDGDGSGSGSGDGSGGGSGSGSGSGGGSMDRWYILHGQFLTTQIKVQQPNGSIASVSNASASADGSYAQFRFTPTQSGVHYVWVTDLDGLDNDPLDPNILTEQFVEFVVSNPNPLPLPLPI